MATVTVLGCGTSSGVPAPAIGWGSCDPDEARNHRLRSSILVSHNNSNLLVDTTPDCRMQLINARIDTLEGVFFTHSHADHTHGINEIRWINQQMGRSIDCWCRPKIYRELYHCFAYAFVAERKHSGPFYAPALFWQDCRSEFPFVGTSIKVFDLDHGNSITQGIRIKDFAYCTDVVNLDSTAKKHLAGCKTWIVDALSLDAHPTHAHLAKVIAWSKELRIAQTYLTHMGLQMDYQLLCQQLPDNIAPAYDGLVLQI